MKTLIYHVHVKNQGGLKLALDELAPGQIRVIIGPTIVVVRAHNSVSTNSIDTIVQSFAT